MKRYGLYVIVGLYGAVLCAQQSDYGLVYRISAAECRQLLMAETLDATFLHGRTAVDTLWQNTLTDTFPLGHYAAVKVVGEEVHTHTFSSNAHQLLLHEDPRQLNISVVDRDGQAVEAPEIRLEKRALSFQSDTRHYTTRRLKGGLLTVTLPDDTLFYTIKALEEKPIVRRRLAYFQRSTAGYIVTAPVRWLKGGYGYLKRGIQGRGWRLYRRPFQRMAENRYKKWVFKGYVASQQPIYRHGDTLRMSAYVANHKGRPLQKSLALTISARNKDWVDTLLAPVADGQYTFDWVLADTLPLDARYMVMLSDDGAKRDRVRQLHYHFNLEDYALKTYMFKVLTTPAFQPYEPVVVRLQAEDANGLPAAATTITGLVRMKSAASIYADTLYIRDTLWTFREEVSDQAIITLAPPDSIWPQAVINVEWEIHFQSPVGEFKTFKQPMVVQRPPFAPILLADADSLRVLVVGDITPARERGMLTIWQENRVLDSVTLAAGSNWPIHPMATRYSWAVDGEAIHKAARNMGANVGVDYQWRNDTLVLAWRNPRRLDIAWTLQSHQGGLKKGVNHATYWEDTLLYGQGRRQAWLHYNYTWQGQQQNHAQDLRALNNRLTLSIDAPERVYPGQTANVALTLTDSKGHTVPDAPLTALAYNAQFNASAPVQATDIVYKGRRIPFKRQGYRASKSTRQVISDLHRNWYQSLCLDTSLYYRLRFLTKEGLAEYTPVASTDSIAQITAQVAPWVVNRHKGETIHLIYLDNRLVYYRDAWQDTPYSIVAEPGRHSLTLRTTHHEVRIRQILLKAGQRLDIGVDISAYDPYNISTIRKPNRLEHAEAEHVTNRLFYLKQNSNQLTSYLYQNDRHIYRLSGKESGIIGWGLFDTNRTLTRLYPGRDTSSFAFEPKFYYQLSKNRERLYAYTPLQGSQPTYLMSSNLPKIGEEAIFQSDIKPPVRRPSQRYLKFDNNRLLGSGRQGRLQPMQRSYAKALIISHQGEILYLLHPHISPVTLPPGTYQLSAWMPNDSIATRTIAIRPYELLVVQLDDQQPMQALSESWRTELYKRMSDSPESVDQSQSANPYTGVGKLISGIVTDDTGEALIGATVTIPQRINGAYIGTITDVEGYYELWVPLDLQDIEVSYAGLSTTFGTITVGNRADVQMSAGGLLLSEVVLVGYRVPVVERDNTTQGMALTAETIRSLPTRNINAIAATTAGLSSEVAIRGSRDEATISYTDGMQTDPLSELPIPTDTLRDSFRDYAYWQPTLLTDRNGQITFPVTFPDDITTWRHTAVAMDGRTRMGIGAVSTQAYLPLQAQLYTPRFLVEGDRASVTGLVTNQTGQSLSVVTSLQQDDAPPQAQTLSVARAARSSYPLPPIPVGMDSTWLTYRLQSNDYQDGERRAIPIYRQGSKRTVGAFHVLNDTLPVDMQADPDKGMVHLRIAGNALPRIVDAIRYLRNYGYHCNEQSASRLFALLAAKEVSAYVAPTDSLDAEINAVLKRLADRQLAAGGWSWWEKGSPSPWITRHVMRALEQAQAAGFSVPDVTASERWLLSGLPSTDLYDRLDGLLFFAERQQPLDYAMYLEIADTLHRDLATEFTYRRIQQLANLPYTLDSLDKYRQMTLIGAHYWGSPDKWWRYGYRHSFRLTLQAYELLKTAGRTDALAAIQQHFLTYEHPDGYRASEWSLGMNTYENSLVVRTLLPDIIGDNAHFDSLAVVFTAQQVVERTVRTFPYESLLPPTDVSGMQMKKSGDGPAFVSYYQQYWETNPQPENNGFEIATTIIQHGREGNRLRLNEAAILRTVVTIKADAEYVLIEIPVPAGCGYGTKKFQEIRHETHREYQRDRVAVFCEKLPAGKYTFTVALEPRFAGSYTLNPVRAEMMYAPTFNGMGTRGVVEIE